MPFAAAAPPSMTASVVGFSPVKVRSPISVTSPCRTMKRAPPRSSFAWLSLASPLGLRLRVRCCCSCKSSPLDAFLFVGLLPTVCRQAFRIYRIALLERDFCGLKSPPSSTHVLMKIGYLRADLLPSLCEILTLERSYFSGNAPNLR